MSTRYQPDGYTTLTPLVVVSPAARAITFYEDVFRGTVTSRMDGPEGTVLHAELQVGDGRLQLMDPHEDYHAVANDPTSDESRFSIAIYVPDVDATVALARDRGARVREEPADFGVTGDLFASIQDPFGVRWTIMCRTEQRTDEQVQQALDEWAASTH
ncbi:VOC family protein [Ornithinimicrobium sp. F0845]|uniref:VOC family protein n=1 Tax=Ornithinimicrobium sp. F0845 TaxID=2926412 RepID=UPI001FF50A43|nr:VOC family protein [Ornithinimicrobium sp. F0845]MCK0113569.1 VOC family protein [Ornithinimicrobium sp. F0845]